ncbi:hypothetical protein R3P38DRAFT_3219058 [Favolaschia claudopus]|uniref:NACHT domain-containing protein n=1 Tax=Favolaschia claudopus TaxID=2862362 RepID=A0AAW0A218_9AGAR
MQPLPSSSNSKMDAPADSDPIFLPDYLRTLKSGLILLLSKVEPILEGTPFKIPFGVVNTVIDLATTVSENDNHLHALFNQVSHQVDVVNAVLPKSPSAEAKARICAFFEYLITELADLDSLAERSTLKKILQSDEDIEIIETAIRRIDVRLKSFHLEITMSIENKIDSSNIDAVKVALRILYNASASNATHDAGESFTHPPCHPNTRLEILNHLTTWSQDTRDSASQILWVHGPAGTGKSAIAQSLCEELQAQHSLASSFFFKRGHPSRGNAAKLWPTIAYQLALISPAFKAAIALRLTSDPALVDKSLPAQLQKLLIDPYHDAEACDDRSLVIVIDGLDECEGDSRQEEILRSLPNLASLPMLRILIVSRPEVHIKRVFGEAALSCCLNLTVPPSYGDVKAYLTDEFKRIREDHGVVGSWPEEDLIWHITRKSSGHFIYAATVIRFVEDKYCDPVDQLAIVTEPQPSEQDSNFVSPFLALDELYLQILRKVPVQLPLSRVLSVIAANFNGILSIAQIGQLLGLKHEKISLTIQRLHSLIKIEKNRSPFNAGAEHMFVYHASFLDFLCDRNRSQKFHFSDTDRENLATKMLEAVSHDPSRSDELHLPYPLIPHPMSFITTTQLTEKLISLLYCTKLEFILHPLFPQDLDECFIAWLELQQAPHDLVQKWAENFFIKRFHDRCDRVLASTRTPEILESELPNINFVRSTTSSDLIRIVQMYRLGALPQSKHRLVFSFGAYIVTKIHPLSEKDVRSIILATRSMLENSHGSVWDIFLLSVGHPTRIRNLHPDPSLEVTAIWLFIPPSWSYILRSCPPNPDLLNVLRRTEEHIVSFINDESPDPFREKPSNPYHHWHNILKWLQDWQTFTDSPIEMLEYVKNQLPADYVENDAMWIAWKKFTGW